ncbi:bifunctional 2-polyprenyl-6-hydroxyphenol methylase/3-demethylubiquinol 3-O-methyltransferase UbiG [Methylococcus sp. EFPC2]|uniref:class I SAM-dependent methyltransferase n=1 Tax=Methylococcus sp. EFPC2 TaxID=2812648 RepID=UPI001968474F|nr:class I SAM-dependent methyltransferase [Methylococcus sp. EFPC2]QSA96917.1 class I SAM-dependent methyltransferase [Methylococcus sp. EFPC2]
MGLQDSTCVLCDANDFSLLAETGRFGFDLQKKICNACGLVQTHPSLKPEFHNEFYDKYYRKLYTNSEVVDYSELEVSQRARGRQILGFVEKFFHISDYSVIEIGCSSGGVLAELKPYAKQVSGCDLDVEGVKYARDHLGLDVEVASLPGVLPKSPRLFILSHVLEHVYSPLTTLRDLWRIMEQDDMLYVEVPSIKMVSKGEYKGDLRRYFNIAHVVDFSQATLLAMAKKAGFKCVASNERVQSILSKSKGSEIDDASKIDSVTDILEIEKSYNS